MQACKKDGLSWQESTSIKTESTRSSSNKWTKTLYQDYLHRIANFCTTVLYIFSKNIISSNTKRRKQMLNFAWNLWKYWWNETDDEILPVSAQFLWTLKFIFSHSHGKCFRCYGRQLFISLALRKGKKDCEILKIILVPHFCPLKTEIARFSIGFRFNAFLQNPQSQVKTITFLLKSKLLFDLLGIFLSRGLVVKLTWEGFP